MKVIPFESIDSTHFVKGSLPSPYPTHQTLLPKASISLVFVSAAHHPTQPFFLSFLGREPHPLALKILPQEVKCSQLSKLLPHKRRTDENLIISEHSVS
jgi:hypothetical protein